MTRHAVTKNLKLSEAASLVLPIRQGLEKSHYLNPLAIQEISDRWMDKYQRGRVGVLAELKKKLEGETDG